MFYVMGQHRKAMINEKVKATLKSKKPNDRKPIDMGKIERSVDADIHKGKTIKLSSYYDSPAPAKQAAELAIKDGATKVIVQYYYYEGEGKSRKKKIGTYKNEVTYIEEHKQQRSLI